MVVVDSSAWIEYLRGSNHPARAKVRRVLASDVVAMSQVVVMEVLAGARTEAELDTLQEHISALTVLAFEGLGDFEIAAGIYRACRAGGETVRSMTDCLTAVVAIRADAPVLHKDRDFDAIARHTPLRVYEA